MAYPLAERLLVEIVRAREEAAGHPAPSPEADAAAIRAGGDLPRRARTRALALSDAATLRAGIATTLRVGRTLVVALLAAFAVLGAGVAAAALGAARPASLPLVLLSIVATNLATLAVWILAQPWSGRIGAGVGAMFRRVWAHLAPVGASNPTLALLASGATGRWLLGSIVHAAWLAFALAALATLAVLLSLRSYALAWETTLLGPDALAAWARALSWGPSLLGLASVDALSVTDTADPVVRQAWARWLLATVFVYGVMPRAIALGACAVMLRRALARFGLDATRPGFARLRARLMPDTSALGVADPAPAASPAVDAAVPGRPLRGTVHGIALEGVAGAPLPPLPGVDWVAIGAIDDGASRDEAVARLRASRVESLAVVVRATMTPDRGVERCVAELVAASRAPAWLVLERFDRLETRGDAQSRQRVADWRSLAARAGADGGVVIA